MGNKCALYPVTPGILLGSTDPSFTRVSNLYLDHYLLITDVSVVSAVRYADLKESRGRYLQSLTLFTKVNHTCQLGAWQVPPEPPIPSLASRSVRTLNYRRAWVMLQHRLHLRLRLPSFPCHFMHLHPQLLRPLPPWFPPTTPQKCNPQAYFLL